MFEFLGTGNLIFLSTWKTVSIIKPEYLTSPFLNSSFLKSLADRFDYDARFRLVIVI
jgi:hypothetical protein